MATFRKRACKWQVQVRRQDKQSCSKTFILKSDAEQWARQQEINFDRDGSANAKPDILFGALLNRYLDQISPRKKGFYFERSRIMSVLRHKISANKLSQLRPDLLASYKDERLQKVKPSTVRREFTILSHVLEMAINEWGYNLSTNPIVTVKRPKEGSARSRRLTPDELDCLSREISKCSNVHMAHAFRFAIATAMRRGEILSLTWGNIDLDARTALLEHTKNGDRRVVPLSPDAIRVLHERKMEGGGGVPPGGAVFPISANALRLAWERAKKRAGVTDLRFHDLRHEAITRFFEMGLSVPEVALISGHKDARMLFRYTHLKPEAVAEKLHKDHSCG